VRILVCGYGSIGKRHASNLLEMGLKVLVWRSRLDLREEINNHSGLEVVKNLSHAISIVDGVVIATATDKHMEIAIEVLKHQKPLFLEKPISHNIDYVDDLRTSSKGQIVEVGCQLRAHPNLIDLKNHLDYCSDLFALTYRLAMGYRLDAWRPNVDYHQSYSAFTERGGGALFDLIHQIDISIWFFGPISEIKCIQSNRSVLNIAGDEISNVLVTHVSGISGQIQLDMVSPVHRCEVEIMTNKGILTWKNDDQGVQCISESGASLLYPKPISLERNDLFTIHMKHWVSRISDNTIPPLCSIEDGISALIAVIKASIDAKNTS
jgi:predicted dehydrogenase